MKYLSLQEFQQENSAYTFPISSEQSSFFRAEVYGFNTWQNEAITDKEAFILACSSEKEVLFLTWTDNQANLESVLKNASITKPFSDKLGLLKHNWIQEYKAFITPYLFPVLRHLAEAKNTHSSLILSYVRLLNEREADAIQEVVFDGLVQIKKQLEVKIDAAKSDQEVVNLLNEMLNPSFFDWVNGFNQRFYKAKTLWLEYLLGLAFHKHSSKPLMLYILDQLKQFELTGDHTKQVKKEEANLKSGIYVFEKTHFPLKRMIALIGGACLLVVGIVALFFIEANPEENPQQEQTAYMHFSPEERIKLDSILAVAKQENQEDPNLELDGDLPFIGQELVRKRYWENQTFNALYSTWASADTVVSTAVFSASKKESRPFPGTEKLKTKDGSLSAELHNDTDKSVLCVVFKNKSKENVYSLYLKAGTVEQFKLNKGDFIFVLPGSAIPKELKKNKLPFNEINSQFFEHLGEGYYVHDYAGKKIKLVWESLGTQNSYLVDINNALERN